MTNQEKLDVINKLLNELVESLPEQMTVVEVNGNPFLGPLEIGRKTVSLWESSEEWYDSHCTIGEDY